MMMNAIVTRALTRRRPCVSFLSSSNSYNTNTPTMRSPTVAAALSWVAYFSSSAATGVPFTRGTKNNNDKDDETTTAQAIIQDNAATSISVSMPPSPKRRGSNSVVDEFFANDNNNNNDPAAAASQRLLEYIRTAAGNQTHFLVQTRRALHQVPELMFQEQKTSRLVQKVLDDLDIPFTTGWGVNTNPHVYPGPGGYGVVVDIGTGQAPCVLLRADMDALPIMEQTPGIADFVSRHDNCMHACGHDGHMTMLLGAAAILKSIEHSIPGTVRLVFQPAEEGGAGGKRLIEEGVLHREPQPQQAFAMHVWPLLPTGTIAGRPGPMLAAAERFEIVIAGVGGHAAMPHMTVDPLVTASAIVMNLQTIVSRSISPLESGVCSITKMEGGEAFNIIPAGAVLRGTVRALTTETLLTLRDKVQHIVQHTAATYGCNATITYSPDYYPPTVNDPDLYENFSKHVAALVAGDKVMEMEPTMGAEDFSFVAQAIPSTFFLLGQGSGTHPPTHYGLHHPHFALDEGVLPRGVELHVNLALRAIQKLRTERETTMEAAAPRMN